MRKSGRDGLAGQQPFANLLCGFLSIGPAKSLEVQEHLRRMSESRVAFVTHSQYRGICGHDQLNVGIVGALSWGQIKMR